MVVPGAVLSFFSLRGMEAMVPGSAVDGARGGVTLEFGIADVDACHEQLLSRGVPVLKPPTTQAWGRRSVWVRDPDGAVVNLYQEV
ncbi:VOC family protein [Streptomyces sp. NPDC048179]|uniref:VOC family protein n=1 Tax=Streptomyces sp. NPDC048179 TaxID=3365506 RepID=UPI00371BA20C